VRAASSASAAALGRFVGLDPHVHVLFELPVPIVKQQFGARFDVGLCEDTDAVVALRESDPGDAIRVRIAVVSKSKLVAPARRINCKLAVQVKEERALVLVVQLSAAIGFGVRHHLAAVLVNKFPLGDRVSDEDSPAGDVRRRQ